MITWKHKPCEHTSMKLILSPDWTVMDTSAEQFKHTLLSWFHFTLPITSHGHHVSTVPNTHDKIYLQRKAEETW